MPSSEVISTGYLTPAMMGTSRGGLRIFGLISTEYAPLPRRLKLLMENLEISVLSDIEYMYSLLTITLDWCVESYAIYRNVPMPFFISPLHRKPLAQSDVTMKADLG